MDERSPEKSLKQFISDMNAWETWAKQNDPREPTEEQWQSYIKICKEKLDSIFNELCTHKRRVYRRQCDFGDPPEYQPDLEDIIEVTALSSSRVEIITQEKSGLENRNKYILLNRQGKWLLDNKQWFDNIDKQWQTGIL
jgi:hypothetical protein